MSRGNTEAFHVMRGRVQGSGGSISERDSASVATQEQRVWGPKSERDQRERSPQEQKEAGLKCWM